MLFVRWFQPWIPFAAKNCDNGDGCCINDAAIFGSPPNSAAIWPGDGIYSPPMIADLGRCSAGGFPKYPYDGRLTPYCDGPGTLN
jgi:hypothetical protein